MIKCQKDPKFYKFDGIFSPNSGNYEVSDNFLPHYYVPLYTLYSPCLLLNINLLFQIFEHVGKPVILGALNGFNGTVFAYGQTGSGREIINSKAQTHKTLLFPFCVFSQGSAVVTKDAENFHYIMHMQKVFSLTFQLVVFLNQFFLSISGMLEQGAAGGTHPSCPSGRGQECPFCHMAFF